MDQNKSELTPAELAALEQIIDDNPWVVWYPTDLHGGIRSASGVSDWWEWVDDLLASTTNRLAALT